MDLLVPVQIRYWKWNHKSIINFKSFFQKNRPRACPREDEDMPVVVISLSSKRSFKRERDRVLGQSLRRGRSERDTLLTDKKKRKQDQANQNHIASACGATATNSGAIVKVMVKK